MWKFKASPFKNAAPKSLKREDWIGDVNATNIGISCGNHIKSSAAYIVFNVDNAGGSSLGVLPLNSSGKRSGSLPTVHAHSDFVTDFDFSPFDDYCLSTCSQDGSAKIWHLPEDGVVESISNPISVVVQNGKRLENIAWNPIADNVLALSTQQAINVYDVVGQSERIELSPHGDQVQSFSWKSDGSLIVSSCRDKIIRIFDARSKSVAQSTAGHQNVKDSRVLWLGEKDLILSTGFDAMRQREVALRDARNLTKSLKTLSVDSSVGTLMPLYDPYTGMIFIAGKGDSSLRYWELSDKEPFLTENSVDRLEQSIKGAALAPKRAMDVMSCEVNRLLILSQNFIIPLMYCVPRKSYRDFQSDLYPDTFDGQPLLSSQEWFGGQQCAPTKELSLNPDKKASLLLNRCRHVDSAATPCSKETSSISATILPAEVIPSVADVVSQTRPSVDAAPSKVLQTDTKTETVKAVDKPVVTREPQPNKLFAGVKQCKFRNLEGTTAHKSQHIENLRNICQSIPGESDGFHVNPKFCSVPLGGSGGLIAILKTDVPGRLPDTGVPAIQNGSSVTDFSWDPFNNCRLAVACDDAKIRIWDIPEQGLTETISEPSHYLHGHQEKIYFVKFHPLASNVLTSASYDMTVRIWDIEEEERIKLTGHTDVIFSLSWSPDGRQCATVCKDGKIRVFEPRKSTSPIAEGQSLEGSRGGRVVWVCNGQLLAITGFDRSSIRQVAVYNPKDMTKQLAKVDLDTSPSILVPHYDEDSSTLFVTSRGDSTVRTFEISPEHPYIFPLSDFKADSLHQALSFLPKFMVDVRNVEFARALRLTSNSIEPVSFRVPRIKMNFFQDDLFPDTKIAWEPVLTGSEWFAGADGSQRTMSLRPADMHSLSSAQTEQPKQKKYESFQEYSSKYKTDEQKKEELLSALSSKLKMSDEPLPQDLADGVDPSEWDD